MEVRLPQNPDRFLTITIARRVLGAEMEWPTLLERRGHSSVVEPETGVVYREAVFRVTMAFVSVLLCVLVLVVCWDSILRCRMRCRWRALFHSQPQPEAVIMSKTGLSRKDVDKLPMIRCMASSSRHRYQGVGSECMICLTEFSEGDKVRLLPSCSHGFHVFCIDLWLLSNASCPACRHTVLPANAPSTLVRDERQQGDIEST